MDSTDAKLLGRLSGIELVVGVLLGTTLAAVDTDDLRIEDVKTAFKSIGARFTQGDEARTYDAELIAAAGAGFAQAMDSMFNHAASSYTIFRRDDDGEPGAVLVPS